MRILGDIILMINVLYITVFVASKIIINKANYYKRKVCCYYLFIFCFREKKPIAADVELVP